MCCKRMYQCCASVVTRGWLGHGRSSTVPVSCSPRLKRLIVVRWQRRRRATSPQLRSARNMLMACYLWHCETWYFRLPVHFTTQSASILVSLTWPFYSLLNTPSFSCEAYLRVWQSLMSHDFLPSAPQEHVEHVRAKTIQSSTKPFSY